MLKDPNSIQSRIREALYCASAHFIRDTVTSNKFNIERSNIEEEVDDIVASLANEIDDIEVSYKMRKDHLSPRLESFVSTAANKRYDIYVVLPVFNASNEQASTCINSIIKNFAGYDVCLVLYTNRTWQELPGLLTTNIRVIEFKSSLFSLPFAYNACMAYLREEFKVKDELIVFMDDDASIYDDQQKYIIQNMASLEKEEFIAISGHYFDNSRPGSLFENAINYSNSVAFAARCTKPYCHGGAVLMLKAKNYPAQGLPLEGLGGISLSILLINCASKGYFKKTGWFLNNNPQLKVFHPRKKNIIQWTATYLSYQIAWKTALSWLETPQRILWHKKLKETSDYRTRLIVNDINENGVDAAYALANLFLTKYYKPLLSNYFLYDDFKSLNLKTHSNLQAIT